MVGKWVVPNHYTFPLLVKVCAEIGLVREGKKAHARVVKFGFEADLFVRNSLIHMYSVCGRIGDAWIVFDTWPDLDLVSWNTMIDGYVKNGEVGVARELFDDRYERDVFSGKSMIVGYVGIGDMEAAKGLFERMTCRDVVLWNCMIDGYARIGNVYVAREFFDLLPLRNVVSWNIMLAPCVRFYMIEPKVEHYGCMVDLLARAGLMKDSKEIISKKPMESRPALWGALLFACRTHSNSELREIVAKQLIELEPRDIGPYVLLSNIYAAEGKWDDVEYVRRMMKEKGLQKASGSSLVHTREFESKSFVGNGSVHRRSMVYSMLSEVGAQMKLSCRDSKMV
ncbi:hypothetical protein FH972_014514 [Carpinus fangiana]|uniref:Pentatricopeptide repeat-containing protein n=1 Tax=Carpinus fangiana TaxID=176857 RepID=A0A5N6RD79_9ROSI|nr:hypothetical protein FH972_014514 [Carpinus fangiana]